MEHGEPVAPSKLPSVELLLRMAHALRFGRRPAAGAEASVQEVYVVASTARPFRVQAIGTLQAARDALADRPGGWSHDEIDARRIFGPFPPPSAENDAWKFVGHPWMTDPPKHPHPPHPPHPHPQPSHLSQVSGMSLRVRWKDGSGAARDTEFPLDPNTDAVFLTRSAIELFLIPAYFTFYGEWYVKLVRELLDPRSPGD